MLKMIVSNTTAYRNIDYFFTHIYSNNFLSSTIEIGTVMGFSDGLIYGIISRHIDSHIPKHFNLVAISFWLLVGDLGSVAGANLISFIRDWVAGP